MAGLVAGTAFYDIVVRGGEPPIGCFFELLPLVTRVIRWIVCRCMTAVAVTVASTLYAAKRDELGRFIRAQWWRPISRGSIGR
jgi:hypothetical protein